MFNVSETCKRMIFSDVAVSLVFYGIAALLIIIFENSLGIKIFNFSLGMIFGTLFTILKILLLEKTVNKAVDMPREQAQNYTRLHYTLRYFLTGAVIVAAVINPWTSIAGVVLALAAFRPAVYFTGWLEKRAAAYK